MTSRDPESVAVALVAPGKGILAADETIPTLTKRFNVLGIQSTEESRRAYREMLFISPGVSEFISGAIMYDETIRQKSSGGSPLVKALAAQGILPGIKVDAGAKPLAGSPGETVTEGLDGLRDRLSEYRSMGACFAKWRAVIRVTETLPSSGCVSANAHALGRYAAQCQEQELVPIVEPEVLMDGSHTIERCEQVTGNILQAVFHALFEQGVTLEATAQAQHGPCRQELQSASFRPGGRDGDIALLAAARACCRAWHRFPVGRSKRAPSNGPSECNQPASWPETLENQLLLRTGTSGSGSRGLAWERG